MYITKYGIIKAMNRTLRALLITILFIVFLVGASHLVDHPQSTKELVSTSIK